MSIDGVRGGAASRATARTRSRIRPRASGRMRRRLALLAGGLLLPLPVLAGCSDAGSGSEGAVVPPDIAATPRAQVRDSGTVRWAIDAMPETLNTFQAGSDAAGDRIAGAVLPALFTLDDRGRPQRNPDYLDSAEVVEREPKQVVVYKINKHARWSNGRPVTVADFLTQARALSGKDHAYWTARNAGYDRIATVEQGGSRQEVRITFAKPYTDWRSLFTPLYPLEVMGSADAFNDGARKTLKVTAGPFQIKGRDTGAKTVTLVRNRRWWGDPAKLDEIVFTAVPRDRRAAALAAGELDIAEVDRPTVDKIHAAARPQDGRKHDGPGLAGPQRAALRGYVVRKSFEPAYTQLALNGESGPLADERVRRAVARAIDRKAIAKDVLKPLHLPAEPQGSHLLMVGQPGYEDNSAALGDQDTQAAQGLLAEAGWHPGGAADQPKRADLGSGSKAKTSGAQVLTKNGKSLTLRFVLPSGPGSQQLRKVGDRIARMLSSVGVATEITKVDDASYFKDHIAAGDFDLALYSWPGSAYPATDGRPIFAKPRPASDGSLLVEQNYTRVGSDYIDQLFDQAVSELDAGASQELVGRADARIWAAAGSIPLYPQPQLVATRSNLVNAGAFGFATPRYQDIGFMR